MSTHFDSTRGSRSRWSLSTVLVLLLTIMVGVAESAVLPLDITSSHGLGTSRPFCTGHRDWTVSQKGPTLPDCELLLKRIAAATKSFRLSALEFVEGSAHPGMGLPTVMTPKEYAWGE